MTHFKKISCLALTCLFFCCHTASAQNLILNTDATSNVSLDYMGYENKYLLLGSSRTTTIIGGMSNKGPLGYLGRMMLQVVDNTPATEMLKTYATKQEVDFVKKGICKSLSVHFLPFDAKQTSDEGFIICGSVLKNFETSYCPEIAWSDYDDIFLLKTDRNGTPQWYKRYDNGDWLYSVIEDPATGNFIACGKNNGHGFTLCVNSSGSPLWAYEARTVYSDDPDKINPSDYKEITPYHTIDGSMLYALTGTSGYYNPFSGSVNKGGVLFTLVDANGSFYTNGVISGDNYSKFLQGNSIHDAFDGDVVIAGTIDGTVCGDKNQNNVLLAKMNPFTMNMTFLKTYNNADAGVASSVTMNKAGGNIYITGTDYFNLPNTPATVQQMYMATDNIGNYYRYVSHDNLYTPISGSAIVYNNNYGFPAYCGSSSGMGSGEGSSFIQDLWGYDCSPFQELEQEDVEHDILDAWTEVVPVNAIPELMLVYNVPVHEDAHCTSFGPAPEAGLRSTTTDDPMLPVPNPATDRISLKLPEGFGNNTEVQLYDMTGKKIPAQLLPDEATKSILLNVAHLAPGLYMVELRSNHQTKRTRFAKQ